MKNMSNKRARTAAALFLNIVTTEPHTMSEIVVDATSPSIGTIDLTVAYDVDSHLIRQDDTFCYPVLFAQLNVQRLFTEVGALMQQHKLVMIRCHTTNFYVDNNLEMARAGFLPEKNSDVIEGLILHGMTEEENIFWYGDPKKLALCSKVWIFATVEYWRQHALRTADSLPLLMYAPELVYTGSRRPRNDMAMFRTINSLTAKREQLTQINQYEYIVTLNGPQAETCFCIPVTRYASALNRGLYFNENVDDFKGTFYYYEPESTTFLLYQRARTFRNKETAMDKLDDEMAHEKHMVGMPEDLIMTPEQIQTYKGVNFPESKRQLVPRIATTARYAGMLLGLFAQEDEFDQSLAVMAEEAGLHILILTHMVGSHQIVTEVLDARPRDESFRCLLYIA
jgi:hypothetical protein